MEGPARGLGRMDRANSGEHRVEGEGQGAVEGNGAGSSEKWMEEGYGARQAEVYCGSSLYLPEIRLKCLKTLLNM